jgi:hypothetical protein
MLGCLGSPLRAAALQLGRCGGVFGIGARCEQGFAIVIDGGQRRRGVGFAVLLDHRSERASPSLSPRCGIIVTWSPAIPHLARMQFTRRRPVAVP